MKKPTSTPLRIPVTITIHDVENLVILAELLCGVIDNPHMVRTGRSRYNFNVWNQVGEGLRQNGIHWRTWEPPDQTSPIIINGKQIKISKGGVQVGCTFVDTSTIMEIVRRMTV